jgi:hypothetical protein
MRLDQPHLSEFPSGTSARHQSESRSAATGPLCTIGANERPSKATPAPRKKTLVAGVNRKQKQLGHQRKRRGAGVRTFPPVHIFL